MAIFWGMCIDLPVLFDLRTSLYEYFGPDALTSGSYVLGHFVLDDPCYANIILITVGDIFYEGQIRHCCPGYDYIFHSFKCGIFYYRLELWNPIPGRIAYGGRGTGKHSGFLNCLRIDIAGNHKKIQKFFVCF